MVNQQFDLKAHALALGEAAMFAVPLFVVLVGILALGTTINLPIWLTLIITVAVWTGAYWFTRNNRQNKERAANVSKI